MKIALFSDIHANLPALRAMLEDVEIEKPDATYCLGDLVGYNVWPNEVINEIRSRRIPCIAGNYDVGIGNNSDDCGCAYKTDEERSFGKVSISYTNSVVGDEERSYLRSLPAHIKIEFKTGAELLKLLLVHGSPRRVNEYLFEDRDEKSLVRIMQTADADIMCFGHTHKPYHRKFEVDGRSLHAINIGSVGKPKDDDPRGCYVIIELDAAPNLPNSDLVTVMFKRFQYNVEEAATAIEASSLPNAYADMLRFGR
jgi:putative phosphoesterase